MNIPKIVESKEFTIRPVMPGDENILLQFVDQNRQQFDTDSPVFADRFLSMTHAKDSVSRLIVKAEAERNPAYTYLVTDPDNQAVLAVGGQELLSRSRVLALGGIALWRSDLGGRMDRARLAHVYAPTASTLGVGQALYGFLFESDASITGVQELGSPDQLTFALIKEGNASAEALATDVGMTKLYRQSRNSSNDATGNEIDNVVIGPVRARFAGVNDGVKFNRTLWYNPEDETYPIKAMR